MASSPPLADAALRSIPSQKMNFIEIDWESTSDDEYEYEYVEEEDEEEGPKQLVTVEPTTLYRTVTTTTEDDTSSSASSVMVPSIDEATCNHCGQETHAPVDCETLRNWQTTDTSGVVVMPSPLLSACLSRFVQDVATRLNIPPSAAAVLLYDVNWDASQLSSRSIFNRQTSFVEVERASGITERCRAHRRYAASDPSSYYADNLDPGLARQRYIVPGPFPYYADDLAPGRPSEQALICNICLETDLAFDQMVSLPCGHAYCRECWSNFFVKTVEITNPSTSRCLRMTCPDSQCNERVTEEEIRKVAPELLLHFESQQFSAFLDSISGGTYARLCPGQDCTFIAIRSREHQFDNVGLAVTVSCDDCGTQFCFRCGEAPHDNECRIVDEKPKGIGDHKNCPRCHVRIEKNGGCNHMTCRCGHHFCWLCLEDCRHRHFCGRERPNGEHLRLGLRLDDHHPYAEMLDRAMDRRFISDQDMPSFDLEYICSTLVDETRNQETRDKNEQWSEDASLVLQKKRQMAHLAHYHARYAAHHQGQRYAAMRSGNTAAQIHAFHQLPDTGTYADFLGIANERLVILRRVLKYSYILAYCLPEDSDSNRMQKDLFQHRQEMLERFTEALSHISENAMSELDRAKVVNLLGIVDKCLMNLLEFMHGIP